MDAMNMFWKKKKKIMVKKQAEEKFYFTKDQIDTFYELYDTFSNTWFTSDKYRLWSYIYSCFDDLNYNNDHEIKAYTIMKPYILEISDK